MVLGIGLTVVSVLILRIGRYQQFVRIGSNAETVILIHRHHQRSTQSHIGRNELTMVITSERDLTTDVADVQTQS